MKIYKCRQQLGFLVQKHFDSKSAYKKDNGEVVSSSLTVSEKVNGKVKKKIQKN